MVVVKKGEPWELLLKQTNFPNRDLLLFKSVCWDSPFYNYLQLRILMLITGRTER